MAGGKSDRSGSQQFQRRAGSEHSGVESIRSAVLYHGTSDADSGKWIQHQRCGLWSAEWNSVSEASASLFNDIENIVK